MAKWQAKKALEEDVNFDILSQINLHAAGIDIGASKIHVSAPKDRDSANILNTINQALE